MIGYLDKDQIFEGDFSENVNGYKYGRVGSATWSWVNASYLVIAGC